MTSQYSHPVVTSRSKSKFLSGFLLGVTVAGILYYFNQSRSARQPVRQRFQHWWQRLGQLIDELLQQIWWETEGKPSQSVDQSQSPQSTESLAQDKIIHSGGPQRRFFVKRGRSLSS